LGGICIKLSWGAETIPLSSVARIGIGSNIRLGAATLNGREAVLGTALMLEGENAYEVAKTFRRALADAQSRLPADVELRPFYDRADLVNVIVGTASRNVAVAAALIFAVLLLFLRSWRAALIPATVLVISFALGLSGMATFGIMGSLLTLGAIDFGVVVDDSIVMVENVVRKMGALASRHPRAPFEMRLATIAEACSQVRKPMFLEMLIIIGAYLPILVLGGVEGPMFRPLALSEILLFVSSLVLALALVPAFCALGLSASTPLAEPVFLNRLRSGYDKAFPVGRRFLGLWVGLVLLLAGTGGYLASRLGADFMPSLDEGWLLVEVQRDPGISLAKSVEMELQTERALLGEVPEIKDLFSRIGMSQIATDPQGAHQNDIYISFQPPTQWRRHQGRALAKAELARTP
jgi:cobalt-zinc-cadmium resistance protein CzcA